MAIPVNVPLTSETQIKVTWTALNAPPTSPHTGGSAIISYNLEWDNGSGATTWSDLLGGSLPDSTATQLTLTSQIVAGVTYKFRVRAKNIYGWGLPSTILSVKAARTPY